MDPAPEPASTLVKESQELLTQRIVRRVLYEYDVDREAIEGESREGIVAEARQVLAWLLREIMRPPLTEIGDRMARSKRAAQKILETADRRMREDPDFRWWVGRTLKVVRERDIPMEA